MEFGSEPALRQMDALAIKEDEYRAGEFDWNQIAPFSARCISPNDPFLPVLEQAAQEERSTEAIGTEELQSPFESSAPGKHEDQSQSLPAFVREPVAHDVSVPVRTPCWTTALLWTGLHYKRRTVSTCK